MSELELHLTSLETSRRLQKAGAEFLTLFCWAYDESTEQYSLMPTAIAANEANANLRVECAAYLASEISNVLAYAGSWTTYFKPKSLYIGFTLRSGARIGNDQVKTEAEGRGQVFAALIEQKMIKADGKVPLL